MCGADSIHRLLELFATKRIHRISAEERKRMRLLKSVPEFFKTNGTVEVALRPKQRHHLAEGFEAGSVSAHSCKKAPDFFREAFRFRRVVNHKLRKRFVGIERA